MNAHYVCIVRLVVVMSSFLASARDCE